MNAAYLLKRLSGPLILLLLLITSPDPVLAGKADPAALRDAVEKSLKVEGVKLDDYELVDQDGVRFRLSDYFKDGKPLVISFIYTSCPTVCPTISAELKKAVDEAREKFRDRFNVLTIGFDTANDTPEKLKEYGRKLTGDFKNFRLATSDEATIRRLASQVGFFYSKQDDGSIDHMDMATTVRPDGTVYKQVYSVRTRSSNIKNRLDELITGKAYTGADATLVDRIKFFCYRYDPYTGRYVIDYAVFGGLFIQLFIILTIVFLVWGGSIKRFFTGAGKEG